MINYKLIRQLKLDRQPLFKWLSTEEQNILTKAGAKGCLIYVGKGEYQDKRIPVLLDWAIYKLKPDYFPEPERIVNSKGIWVVVPGEHAKQLYKEGMEAYHYLFASIGDVTESLKREENPTTTCDKISKGDEFETFAILIEPAAPPINITVNGRKYKINKQEAIKLKKMLDEILEGD